MLEGGTAARPQHLPHPLANGAEILLVDVEFLRWLPVRVLEEFEHLLRPRLGAPFRRPLSLLVLRSFVSRLRAACPTGCSRSSLGQRPSPLGDRFNQQAEQQEPVRRPVPAPSQLSLVISCHRLRSPCIGFGLLCTRPPALWLWRTCSACHVARVWVPGSQEMLGGNQVQLQSVRGAAVQGVR